MKKVRKMCVNSMLTSVLALSALWLSSCSHDEFPVDKPAVPGTKGTLTFVLPLGGNKGVTYASPTTADVLQGLDDEFKIEDLWIYWFRDSDDKLQGYFSLDGGTIQMGASPTTSTPTTTATITVGDNDSPSKFYIVANVNGTSPVKADGLVVGNIPGQLMVNETTSAQFEARLANLLADSNGEILEADNLTTPLPMSISSKTSSGGYVQVSDPSSAGTISDIHLKRRVARFDILNNSDYSNFVITSVYVSKAQRTGWMHDIDGVASTTWAADSLGKFVILDKANGGTLNLNGTPSIKVDTIDWSSGSPVDGQQDKIFDDFQLPDNETDYKDSLERAKAVFYLYPTEVAADGSKTEIMIEGELYGIKKIYSLDLKDLQGKVDIVANKLYTIKVKRSVSNQVKFELIVDEWDDGVEIPAGGATSGITEWGSATAETGETFDLSATAPNSYTYSSASEVTLTIVNKGTALNGNGHVSSISFSPVGVVDQDYLQSDYNSTATGANVTSETPAATYGAVYTTTHTIKLPPTNAPITVEMKITNAGNPLESKVINLTSVNFNKAGKAKVGTLLNPSLYPSLVSFGTNRWKKAAVVDVDATGMPTKVIGYFGNDFPNKLNVSSTKGLEDMLADIATSGSLIAEITAYAAVNAGRTATGISIANTRTAATALGALIDKSGTFDIYVIQAVTTPNTATYYTTTDTPVADKSSTYTWFWNNEKNFLCPLTY